jgi:hypothetical protein
MPYRLWRHVCRNLELLIPSPDCHVCGGHGEFAEWRLSNTEADRLYRWVYELDPIGPQRALANRMLGPMRTPCVRCGGRAVLTIDAVTWSACPICEGTGGIWNRPPEEVEAARRQVLLEAAKPQQRVTPVKEVARQRARGRLTGFSSHGLEFAKVEWAFAEAERILGGDWKLKGRGHCRRATLDPRYSSHARKGAARSSAEVFIIGGPRRKRVMPLAIIEKAAELLGVTPSLFMCREY